MIFFQTLLNLTILPLIYVLSNPQLYFRTRPPVSENDSNYVSNGIVEMHKLSQRWRRNSRAIRERARRRLTRPHREPPQLQLTPNQRLYGMVYSKTIGTRLNSNAVRNSHKKLKLKNFSNLIVFQKFCFLNIYTNTMKMHRTGESTRNTDATSRSGLDGAIGLISLLMTSRCGSDVMCSRLGGSQLDSSQLGSSRLSKSSVRKRRKRARFKLGESRSSTSSSSTTTTQQIVLNNSHYNN